jgi:hypothetical protein
VIVVAVFVSPQEKLKMEAKRVKTSGITVEGRQFGDVSVLLMD